MTLGYQRTRQAAACAGSLHAFVSAAFRHLRQIDWTGSIRTFLASGLHNVTGPAVEGSGHVAIIGTFGTSSTIDRVF